MPCAPRVSLPTLPAMACAVNRALLCCAVPAAVGPQPPRPAAAAQPVDQRGAVGVQAPHPLHPLPRVPLAGGPPPRPAAPPAPRATSSEGAAPPSCARPVRRQHAGPGPALACSLPGTAPCPLVPAACLPVDDGSNGSMTPPGVLAPCRRATLALPPRRRPTRVRAGREQQGMVAGWGGMRAGLVPVCTDREPCWAGARQDRPGSPLARRQAPSHAALLTWHC